MRTLLPVRRSSCWRCCPAGEPLPSADCQTCNLRLDRYHPELRGMNSTQQETSSPNSPQTNSEPITNWLGHDISFGKEVLSTRRHVLVWLYFGSCGGLVIGIWVVTWTRENLHTGFKQTYSVGFSVVVLEVALGLKTTFWTRLGKRELWIVFHVVVVTLRSLLFNHGTSSVVSDQSDLC